MFYFIFIIRDYHLLPLNFLYIIFNIIKAMLIEISDKSRIVTQRRQKKKYSLRALLFFCLAQRCDLYNSCRLSAR